MPLFNKDKIQLKKPLFLFLGFTLYPLLIIYGISGYFLEEHHFQKNNFHDLKMVEELLEHQNKQHTRELQSLISHYAADPALQEAFLSQSRQELYQAAFSDFQAILQQDITHFYFINLDKTCFLRVHNPERHDDLINRFTIEEAARTGRVAAGLELGPYGTLTLRVVEPWYVDDKLIGYIELGRDIKNCTGDLSEILGMDLMVLINKRFLDRQKWQEGLWMTGKTGDWDEDKKHVIFDRTIDNLPQELIQYLEKSHEGKEDLMFRVNLGGRDFRGGFLPLRDAQGTVLGEIIALRDNSKEFSYRVLNVFIVAGSAGLGVLIFGLFYLYTNSIEGRLQQSYSKLKDEIESRKDVEKQLRIHEEELELLVNNRTTRLEQTNIQLQQEVKERIKIGEELLKAQRLESIGILAGGIAHDFNNLLMIILGSINLVSLDGTLSTDGKTLLHEAEKASLQARSLTRQLITFSDGGSPVRTIVDICELTQRVVNNLRSNTITCSFDIQKDLWPVEADEKQLEQVVSNIIDNASAAMNNSGTIEISCSNQDCEDQKNLSLPALKFVKISFKDNGCGIAGKNLSKIFDPYFSTKPKDSSKGSGLGLAIVHSIITKHEGFIHVDSQEGTGSTFTIYLPAVINTGNS
jgi:signal transduction histidine kinase